MCLFFIFLFTFSLCFSTQNYVGSMTGGGGGGWGVFICGHGHRAKKWRTVGQNLTYAGLKSDVWAKMQHLSVIIIVTYHNFKCYRFYNACLITFVLTCAAQTGNCKASFFTIPNVIQYLSCGMFQFGVTSPAAAWLLRTLQCRPHYNAMEFLLQHPNVMHQEQCSNFNGWGNQTDKNMYE